MIRSQQAVHPKFRVQISRNVRQQALVPLPAADAQQLALIIGYQAMALINRDLTRAFTPCEEEAERRLTQFRMTQH
ncbi:hypothetical protein [Levilactobacillus zymae]|uniref:Programmed cell death antitoxin YdcD n=1 Tax=Levilactobacillus zymae TaxID=267363 RepID=A0A1Y6JUG2_9LACO|nr:hypothetical protein [Levilactobacillus zymae]KRL15097.1 hypothetical protein FD38_GL000908 [Levilactobacillus zymae DSM 19395]QFR61386.1 hypothetical protein LZ395_07625 [Levilactobacillus zymae]GEO71736.1 hypothetical protein LZY01_09040 [Levilactobacillus zymae]SMS13597.1 Programmed cell death antitoxin YdcD [Levilactobacillus zymae]